MIRIPGLIDPHVHMREPGGTQKEDWQSGTCAALAGGFTTVLAMPNTAPAICDEATLAKTLDIAGKKAHCDFAQFVGAGSEHIDTVGSLAGRAAGLKLYLDQTFGPLQLRDTHTLKKLYEKWPVRSPLCVHAEGKTLAAALQLAEKLRRSIHCCHISKREEILWIKAAKERGVHATCEVTPHHLFLCEEDIPAIGMKRAEVRPRLASRADRQALWDHLTVIDCFASDHAPHTLAEKDGLNPPPGFPGVETALPLYLTAVHEGRLTLEDVIFRCVINPQRIFYLPAQPETWVEVDLQATDTLHAAALHSRCGWTPFEGWKVQGLVRRVVLRGEEVCRDGLILNRPGSGRDVRNKNFDSNQKEKI